MGRFTELVDIDGHGTYLPVFNVMGLLPIRERIATEKDVLLYEAGARTWIVTDAGFMHASIATAEEIYERIGQLEQEQREAERAKRDEDSS